MHTKFCTELHKRLWNILENKWINLERLKKKFEHVFHSFIVKLSFISSFLDVGTASTKNFYTIVVTDLIVNPIKQANSALQD